MPKLFLSNKTWLVSEIHYIVDRSRGTVCDVTLFPPEAFYPAPFTLDTLGPDRQQAAQAARNGGQPSGETPNTTTPPTPAASSTTPATGASGTNGGKP